MKPLKMFFMIAFLGLSSCNTEKSQSSDIDVISIIVDKTDSSFQTPGIESIRPRLRVAGGNHTEGAIFRLGEVSDIEYSPTTNLSIESEQLLLQNPGERKRSVNSFLLSVESALANERQQPSGKPASQIFSIVAREANAVSTMKGVRTLYVISDLMENSPSEISFYNKKTLETLKNHPEMIAKKLEALQPLQNLQGLKLVLVFHASDYANSEKFHLISKVYKKIFEAHNATISIIAKM